MKKKNGITRRERNDKLTNWYMINLSWGVVGIIVLNLISRGYKNPGTIGIMQPLVWVLFGVLLACGIVCIALGKKGIIKNQSRAKNYAIFSFICSLVGLWLGLYNTIRPLMEKVLQAVTQSSMIVTSYWNTRLPIIGIVIYLVVAFIYYAVKVNKK